MNEKCHELLHTLWSKAVGTPDYVKSEWMELEKLLVNQQPKHDLVVQALQQALEDVGEITAVSGIHAPSESLLKDALKLVKEG